MQISNMQDVHWMMIANSRQTFFADCLVPKKFSFVQALNEQGCQNHHSPIPAFAVSTKKMQFHPFKLRQEEITGVHGDIALSFISNYM